MMLQWSLVIRETDHFYMRMEALDIYHDMKRYHTGKSAEGHDTFSIPLKPDDDGMVGRECPNENCQPRYFKIAVGENAPSSAASSAMNLTCPYCDRVAHVGQFHTKEQIEWVKSMIKRDLAVTVQNMFQKAFPTIRPVQGGLLSISMQFRPGHIPDVRPYAEEKLKRAVQCDKCGKRYAVYGISYQCPLCGGGNLLLHFRRSAEIIRSLLEVEQLVKEKAGEEAVYNLWGNCLEDIASLFEGFLKVTYSRDITSRYALAEAQDKIGALKGSFQRLSEASRIFGRDLNTSIFSSIAKDEVDFLDVLFNKRHVITHNLGLVDEKFQSKINQWQRRGEELEISRDDILKGLSLVERIINNVVKE